MPTEKGNTRRSTFIPEDKLQSILSSNVSLKTKITKLNYLEDIYRLKIRNSIPSRMCGRLYRKREWISCAKCTKLFVRYDTSSNKQHFVKTCSRKCYLDLWYFENKKRIKIRNAEHYRENIELHKKRNTEWANANKQRTLEHRRKRRAADPTATKAYAHSRYLKNRQKNPVMYGLNNSMSGMMRQSLKGNKKGRHWETLVDYTLDELREHLESHFVEGMSWDNYGEWHIDHKIPQAWFNITSAECDDFKKCWDLKNLQPLWAHDNKSKRHFYAHGEDGIEKRNN